MFVIDKIQEIFVDKDMKIFSFSLRNNIKNFV